MRKLSYEIAGAIGRDEVLRAARAQKVLRQWEEVVGPFLAAKSTPDRYDHGTVWVAVDGSAWAQELRMLRDTILKRLKELAHDDGLFHDVRFGVRPLQTQAVVEIAPEDKRLPHREKLADLTIQEIRERRLKNWPREG